MSDPVDWKAWKKNKHSGVGRHRRGGNKGPRHRNDERGGQRGMGIDEQRGGSSRGGRDRPPGLRGKAIGLWYRDRNKGKKKEQEKVKPVPVNIDQKIEVEIRESLEKVKAKPPIYLVNRYSKVNSETCVKMESDDIKGKCGTSSNAPNLENMTDKYSHLQESNFKKSFLKSITGSIDEILNQNIRLDLVSSPEWNEQFKEELLNKQTSPHYQEMMMFRKKLPSYKMKDEIVKVIEKNKVVVISGETGCGKTTQVAQFILDNEIMNGRGSRCHIICTQPRRISAIAVAERVADERDEPVGQDTSSVGYQIRLEKSLPRRCGSVLFCTTGILLQKMENDPALISTSHVIIDEIHERDTLSDFAMTILRDVVEKRTDLKLILMSATLNAERFSKYYYNCPMLTIPGFTYPVTEYYLEDIIEMTRFDFFRLKRFERRSVEKSNEYREFIEPHVRNLRRQGKYSERTLNTLLDPSIEDHEIDIIFELIFYISYKLREPGAILVFLPGWEKISTLNKRLNDSRQFPTSNFVIIPLHSLMPTAMQKKIFERPPPGVRKIVIATNIAETSITIDDIVYVIDCGKIKMKNFDAENNIATLQPEWVSLANARQRRGRAGRVQEGVCYHLFSKAREMTLQSYPLPEMLRTRLEEVILRAKILQLGLIKPFLQKVLDPPDATAIDVSLKMLTALNALDDSENLTPLGYHLAQLPLDPQTGKMILMGALFKCIDPIFTIAASLSFKDAFIIPLGKEGAVDIKRAEFDMERKSDHIMFAEAFSQWEQSEHNGWGHAFCRDNFLARSILCQLKDMKKQFAEYLFDMQFLRYKDHKAMDSNINSNNVGLIRAIVCAGLYPNVAVIRRVKRIRNLAKPMVLLLTEEDGKIGLHPRSVNSNVKSFESRFLLYHLKLKTTKINIHDTSMVHALPLIFFGRNINMSNENHNVIIELSNLIRFSVKPSTASLITDLRIRLDWLLEEKITNPHGTNWNEFSDEGCILRAITKLITIEDKQLMGEDSYDDDDDSLLSDS